MLTPKGDGYYMYTENNKNIIEICREEKVIFALGRLNRTIESFDYKGYTIYIVSEQLSLSQREELIEGIKEGDNGNISAERIG